MLDLLGQFATHDLVKVSLATGGIFIAVIAYTRIAGLRSFSKMSAFDFAMTVAVGSLIATTAVLQASLIEGLIALAVLYVLQVIIAILRRHGRLNRHIDNQPLLLVKNGAFLEDNMREARVTRGDVVSKLREANVQSLKTVQAVVLETTGDISVLHSQGSLGKELLEGVREDINSYS